MMVLSLLLKNPACHHSRGRIHRMNNLFYFSVIDLWLNNRKKIMLKSLFLNVWEKNPFCPKLLLTLNIFLRLPEEEPWYLLSSLIFVCSLRLFVVGRIFTQLAANWHSRIYDKNVWASYDKPWLITDELWWASYDKPWLITDELWWAWGYRFVSSRGKNGRKSWGDSNTNNSCGSKYIQPSLDTPSPFPESGGIYV